MAEEKKSQLPKWYQDTRRKEVSQSGNLVFTILRLVDLPLQYHLLHSGLGLDIVRKLGGTSISPSITTPGTVLGLSPYHSLIWSFAAGASLKQIYWCLFVCDNAFEPGFSTTVAMYNTALNTLNTLLSLWALSSNYSDVSTWTELLTLAPNRSTIPIGVGLYVLGILTEWWCEVQRKQFKQNPENKGKLYAGGLFGYSIVCAGLPWDVAVGMFLFGDFAGRAVPYLETYLKEKYGQQFVDLEKKVPYKMVPWIY